MRIKRVGKLAAWATVVVLATATTVGVMLVAKLGYGGIAPHTSGRLGPVGWLIALVAALAPWWGICAVVARREWARAIRGVPGVSDPRRAAR